MKRYATLLTLGALAQSTSAFLGPSNLTRNRIQSSTQVQLLGFLNEAKKALVKKMAGEYDAEAVRARVGSLVNENPVLMLSFTT